MSKATFLLSTLTLAAVSHATAQVITVGAKVGVNTATLAQTSNLLDSWSGEARIGFVGGATFAVGLGKIIGIRLEAIYAEKGTGTEGMQMRSRYLEAPILVTATIPTRAAIRPIFLAGVVPSIEISCGGWTRPMGIGLVPEAPPPPLEPLDCTTMRTNRDDLGGVLGGGIQLAFSRWSFTAELRYTESLTDIGRYFEFGTIHNRTFAILVGTALQISGG
jgi:hypothetical protein